jgi:hypothetical protein
MSMYWWNGLSGSFLFVAPTVLETLVIATLISGVCFICRTKDEKDTTSASFVSFAAIARMTVAFALFGYVLGTFTGMTGQSLATTIVGTVSTTAATYLAYLYSKDTLANSRLVIVSALSAFFIAVPLAVQYVTHYG